MQSHGAGESCRLWIKDPESALFVTLINRKKPKSTGKEEWKHDFWLLTQLSKSNYIEDVEMFVLGYMLFRSLGACTISDLFYFQE